MFFLLGPYFGNIWGRQPTRLCGGRDAPTTQQATDQTRNHFHDKFTSSQGSYLWYVKHFKADDEVTCLICHFQAFDQIH